VAALAGSLSIGDPLDLSTQIGPLVSGRQRDRVEGYIAKGVEEGSRIVAGGGRPQHLDRAGTSSRPCSPTSTTVR